MIRLPNIRDLLTLGPGQGRFAFGLMTALLAALGAWPTPGLLRDSESKRHGSEVALETAAARLLTSHSRAAASSSSASALGGVSLRPLK